MPELSAECLKRLREIERDLDTLQDRGGVATDAALDRALRLSSFTRDAFIEAARTLDKKCVEILRELDAAVGDIHFATAVGDAIRLHRSIYDARAILRRAFSE